MSTYSTVVLSSASHRSAAVDTSSKDAWPELVGAAGSDAVATIQRERPDLTKVTTVPAGSMMTMDFRTDRVRIIVNGVSHVESIPRIG